MDGKSGFLQLDQYSYFNSDDIAGNEWGVSKLERSFKTATDWQLA
jgi:hypothetical protein